MIVMNVMDVKKMKKYKISEMQNDKQDNDEILYENVMSGKVEDQTKVVKQYMKIIEMLIVAGMTNHVYRFNNKVRIQVDGGPIGLSLTGQVADCYMIDWDSKFMQRLEKYEILPAFYSRFKDDILIVTERLQNGSENIDGKIVINEEKKAKDETKVEVK